MHGLTVEGSVRVEDLAPRGMITLRGDLSDATVSDALARAAGLAVPDRRGIAVEGEKRLAWMSPDEALLILPRARLAATLAGLTETLASSHALAADMSDARALLRLTGEDAALREVLARLAPVDMATFATGEIRRTRLAQVACAFWMPAPGTVEVICFRSVARYAFDLLAQAAASPRIS
ncbi:sarcosine oxidase, gamma subunit family protein [Pseudooceanicola batsensis HTCC2597]|uniref:Sarcosine oxidase, gamma subunit family protein n=1 Tax=Pseudooceanicola batsensis (strain ATCC BAA-863 / DSM 15984 / KCTC 12145 / HTCC2597) TaxID=252305 RepID=A3TSC4_PSEBH|nr:sarcosine oxidase, gamma subunit family protein [Pseudooceanicola batsensis HTCC2597]